jgi:hypothetical protein
VANVLDKYIKQVSSNTGAVVTPSGINAYNIDPRIGQQYQDLVSTVNSGISNRPAGTDVLSKYLTQLTDLSKPAPKKKNALQSILSNKIVATGLKPLEALDYGRRAVTSTLKEAYDYGKTGEFSTEDWRKQTNDPTFGVGKFVNTGNKWLDRGLGFLGDVALDPVNYVTLGAGTFIGAGGRAALATRLLEAGASEALVSKAGKLGLAGLKTAEREAYNLPRAGLYLGQSIRIPGTGLPGAGLGRTLAETRGLIGSTPVGGVIRRARTPEAFIEAAERLATGKGALSAREATAILSSAKYMAGAEGMVLARINQELTPIVEGINSVGDKAGVTYALERGAMDVPMAAESRKFLDDNFARMVEAGQVTPEMYRPNYVPHVWSDAGQKILSSESQFARDFRTAFGVTVDEVRAPSAARARVFNVEPGKVYKINGKELTFATDTVDEINRVFLREFPELGGAKVLEDDITKLLSGHARQTSQAVANGAFAKRLQSLGVTKDVSEVATEVVDNEATKAAAKAQAKATKKFVKDMQPTVKAVAEAQKVVIDEYNGVVQSVGKAAQDTLAAKKLSLGVELDSAQKSFNEFLLRNKSAQISLEEQGRYLDNLSEYLTNLVENNNTKLQLIADFPNSPEGVRLLAEKEYADSLLGNVKEIQSYLDESIGKIDSATIDLATAKQLGPDADKAAKTRMLPEPNKVEPYRVISGGEVVGRETNTILQFTDSLNNSRNLVATFSPEAHNLLVDAGNAIDEAMNLRQAVSRNLSDAETIREAVWKRNALQSRYDELKGIADRYNARTAKLRSINSYSGLVSAMPEDVLPKLFTENDINFIKMFERDIMPIADRAEAVSARTQSLVGAEQKIEDLQLTAQANFRQAKDVAMKEVQGMVDTPWLSVNVQNKVMESYSNLFDEYQKGVEVIRKLNSIDKNNLTTTQARAAIKEAAAIAANIEEATFRFRIHADFTNRYKDVVSQVAVSGQPFNADAIAGYVMKQVLDTEIRLGRDQLKTLVEAQRKILKGAVDAANGPRGVGNVDAVTAIAKTVSDSREKNSSMLQMFLQNYLDKRYEYNTAIRGEGSTARITDEELRFVAGENASDVNMSSSGFYTTNLETADADSLLNEMQDLKDIIIPFIYNTADKTVDVDALWKDFNKKVIIRGKGKTRSAINPEALTKWIADNGIYQQPSSRYIRATAGERASGDVLRQGDAAARAVGEQIENLSKRMESLTEYGKLVGRKPRVSSADKRVLSSVVDIGDPAAVAKDLAEKVARQQSLVGTKDTPGELGQLDASITKNRKEYAATARRQKWKQPSGEAQKQLVKLNENLQKVKEEVANWVEKNPNQNLPDGLANKLDGAEKTLSSFEDKQLVFSGSSEKLKTLTAEHNALVKARVEMNAEITKLKLEIDYSKAVLNNPPIQVKLKNGQMLKDWESILFGPGLGKSKTAARNLFREQGNLIRQQVELRVQQESAQSLVDTADSALAATTERVFGPSYSAGAKVDRTMADVSETAVASNRVAKQQLDAFKATRDEVNVQLDNTKQIGIDSSVAASEALVEVRDQIDLVERNARELANVPNVKNSDAMTSIEASNKWLDEAVAMTSPQGYVDRVGFSAKGGTLTSGTSEAQKFAFLFAMDATPEQQATAALVAKAHALEGQMLTAIENKQAVEAMVRGAKDMKFPAIMVQQMQDGFKEIGKTGIAVSPQIQQAMQRVMKLNQPGEWAQFWKVWDGYTDVFKAYATMSPRFHVRNALSATLMNYSDGVSTRNMLDGTKLWREIKNDANGWAERLPANQRQEFIDAVNAVYASGGGAYGDFNIGTFGTRNKFVAKSKAIGTTIEGSVRLGMALDTIRSGGSFEEAVARINRIHFNYSDVSKVDGYAKKIIPFWTFMSRNLPMQMQQMWLKPRMYAIYASAARNFSGEPDNNIVPSYQMESGAFKSPIGRGLITPDLPWMKSQQDLMKLTSLAGIVSNTTPLIKTPLELYSGKSTFTGAPIKDGALYAAQQMLPMYQTVERLGGIGSQEDRAGKNWASWLGVPYQQTTIQQQKSELIKRIMMANEAITGAKK